MIRNLQYVAVLLLMLLCVPDIRAADRVCDIEETIDLPLQQELTAIMEQLGITSASKRGRFAVSLLVLTDPEHPRLAQVNGDKMIYAASLPKIAILLGAAVAMDEGKLKPDKNLRKDMKDMIQVSCNACASRVLEAVGRKELLDILQAPKFAFYDKKNGGGLWVGKPYGPETAYKRDPLYGLSHGATTFQVSRFYCALESGTLVSPEQTAMMMDAMSHPKLKHKFVRGLKNIEGLDIYRKSGTWRTFHADSAMVKSDGHTYVMVALANSALGGIWMEKLALPLHKLAISPPD